MTYSRTLNASNFEMKRSAVKKSQLSGKGLFMGTPNQIRNFVDQGLGG